MGKKSKGLQPDADGVLRPGIYEHTTRAAKPRPYDPSVLERLHAEASRSLLDRLRDYRAKLVEIVAPFVEGPPASEASFDAHEPGQYGHINIDGESKFYRQLPEIESGTVEANCARDAVEALPLLESVEHKLTRCTGPGDCVELLFQDAYNLGRTGERLSIRHNEPLVRARRSSEAALKDRNSKRTSTADLRRQAEQAIEATKAAHPGRTDDDDFIKDKAAESLGIK